jgi:hypothetical protein
MSDEGGDGYSEAHRAFLREHADLVKYLEMRGEHDVRAALLTGTFYPADQRGMAARWLALKDEAAATREAASTSEQILLARESNSIASEVRTITRQARTITIAALVVATISAIAAIIGWFIH